MTDLAAFLGSSIFLHILGMSGDQHREERLNSFPVESAVITSRISSKTLGTDWLIRMWVIIFKELCDIWSMKCFEGFIENLSMVIPLSSFSNVSVWWRRIQFTLRYGLFI